MPCFPHILWAVALILTTVPALGQVPVLLLHPDSLENRWEKRLEGWAFQVDGTLPEATFETVCSLPLKHHSHDSFYFSKNRVIWLSFALSNQSIEKPLDLYIGFDNEMHLVELYRAQGSRWEEVRTGSLAAAHHESAPPNFNAISVHLDAGERAKFYLRLYRYWEDPIAVRPVSLLSPAAMRDAGQSLEQGMIAHLSFSVFFLGAILVIMLFALVGWFFLKDKAYLFYGLYLACLFLYYLKNFELAFYPLLAPSILGRWIANVETLTITLSFITYLQFIRHFLGLDQSDERLAKTIRAATWFFVGMLAVDVALQLTLGPSFSIHFFKLLYLPFFVLCFYFLWVFWKRHYDTFSKIVIIGTCCMLLPVLVMRLADFTNIPYGHAAWSTMRVFHVGGSDFYFLHTKTGLLLEVFCFLLGLSWKTREERWEMAKLATALQVANTGFGLTASNGHVPVMDGVQDVFLQNAHAQARQHCLNPAYSPYHFANDLNYSHQHVSRLIKERTGLSISLFIQQHRLEVACELLRTSNQPIKQVAYSSGFDNPAYFARIFKAMLGISPSDFRKNGFPDKE